MALNSPIRNLRHAVEINDIETVCRVLSNNPNILDLPNKKIRGSKVLRKAVNFRRYEIMEILLKFGADVNEVYPLKDALRNRDAVAVELLLENGAIIQYEDFGSVFSEFLSEKDDAHRLDILIILLKRGLDVEYRDATGRNLFQIFLSSVTRSDCYAIDIAEILVNHKVSVDEEDADGKTALIRCIERNNTMVLQLLLDRGANVNHVSSVDGNFPLYVAVSRGNRNITNVLLSYNAAINTKHIKDGSTVLHKACLGNNEGLVASLVDHGVDLNAENNNGYTAFSLTGRWINVRSKFILIKALAKLHFENVAISEKDMELIRSDARSLECFSKCKAELTEMNDTKFYNNFSYYDILKISRNIKKLANLTLNDELVDKFFDNLIEFSYFYEELSKAWNKAIKVGKDLNEVNDRLFNIFNFLPFLVRRKLASNLTLDDLPIPSPANTSSKRSAKRKRKNKKLKTLPRKKCVSEV